MDEQQAERVAANEVLFRTVNEQLVELNEAFEPLDPMGIFVCECGRIACVERIEMTLAEYAAIRRDPRRFFIMASDEHVIAASERVVERAPGYFVVEKVGVGAEIAELAARGSAGRASRGSGRVFSADGVGEKG